MRWHLVEVTRTMHSDSMRFYCSVHVSVMARDAGHAMRLVRPEFRHCHLRVVE